MNEAKSYTKLMKLKEVGEIGIETIYYATIVYNIIDTVSPSPPSK